MVEFETITTKEIKFGKNKFLEVARKKAKSPEGENEFISISRGFILPCMKPNLASGTSALRYSVFWAIVSMTLCR